MPTTTAQLTKAVEDYLRYLRLISSSGGATDELSYYPPLNNLLNAVGRTLKPKVFCVSQLAQQGAGHPDFGLYGAKQVQKGQPREGQLPERGVVEVKSASDDAWLTADSEQVSKYWNKYRLVLATNTRDFVLLGEDATGQPVKLETFQIAESAEAFESRLEKPRSFARDVGPGLGEYLCRALTQQASIAEPKDLAWLLASYARDGLHGSRRQATPHPSRRCGRRWRRPWVYGSRESAGRHFSGRRWCKPSSTASSPHGFSGRGRRRRQPAGSTGTTLSGIFACPYYRRCSSRYRPPAN